AILLAEGDNGATYANVSDILIANNTIVKTPIRGIYIGWWPNCYVKPNNLTFKNNIIKSSTGTLVRDEGHTGTFIWENNLHYATGSATYWVNDGGVNEPASGITHANPDLIQGTYIQRLQASSANAIENGTADINIADDIDGHSRDATNPDIGCDEYSASAPIRTPVTEDEVGPSWMGADSDINNDGKVNLEDFAILACWWYDENTCSSLGWCGGADFNMSGTIDFADLAYFVENWLRQAN
ncbi:MAG: hypothetical protein KAT56_09785, partial [Sedimentisphaerales bacterium]|nr:hypothetical protein [Sedimentisphaerales bacterium]